MNKAEYIQTIEKALVGNVSPQEVQDIVSYYRDYIDMEIQKGRSEQEVLEQLGNPRLLVKSMIAAKAQREENKEKETIREETARSRSFRIPLFLIVIIIFLVLLLALRFILAVANFLIPILIPVALVMGVVSLIKRLKK